MIHIRYKAFICSSYSVHILKSMKHLYFFLYSRYIEYNVKSLEICRKYHHTVPRYLQNRPKLFVQHCMERLPPNCTHIPQANIIEESSGIHVVRSVDSENSYTVCLDEDGPTCSCMDWGKNHWPCKHMLAVFGSIEGWEWDCLPISYRDCPQFSLDPIVNVASANLSHVDMQLEPTNDDDETDDLDPFHGHEIEPVVSQSVHTNTHTFGTYITRCTHLIKDIQNNLYGIDSETSFEEVVVDLQALYSKTKEMLPLEEGLPVRKELLGPTSRKRKQKNPLPLRRKRRGKLSVKSTVNKGPSGFGEAVVIEGTFDTPTVIEIQTSQEQLTSSEETSTRQETLITPDVIQSKRNPGTLLSYRTMIAWYHQYCLLNLLHIFLFGTDHDRLLSLKK